MYQARTVADSLGVGLDAPRSVALGLAAAKYPGTSVRVYYKPKKQGNIQGRKGMIVRDGRRRR